MDFFARQQESRTRSRLYLFAFAATVAASLSLLYLAVTGCVAVINTLVQFSIAAATDNSSYLANYFHPLPASIYGDPPRPFSFRPIFMVTAMIACFLAAVSFIKMLRLRRGGGAYVAKSLGAVEILEPSNFQEKQFLHVVEEMAIASGLPCPRLYVMADEPGINAVTAGRDHDDAVIVVTRGALDQLNREELQGVVAHEFAHILNNDVRLNMSMAGGLFGLLVFFIFGQGFLHGAHLLFQSMGVSSRDKGFPLLVALALTVCGLILIVSGWLGKMAAEIFQAAFSRQREYLADAFAVGFTRNPKGLSGALKKVAALPRHGALTGGRAQLMKSFFIVSPDRMRGLLRSHPPLEARIAALEPGWDGQLPDPEAPILVAGDARALAERGLPPASAGLAPADSAGIPASAALAAAVAPAAGRPYFVVEAAAESLPRARSLVENLPAALSRAVEDPIRVGPLTAALFFHHEPELAEAQREITRKIMGRRAADLAVEFRGLLSDEARLPLLSLAAPALKALPEDERFQVLQTARKLAATDGRTDFFEVAAFQILNRALNPQPDSIGGRPSQAVMEEAAATLVSIMAHVGSADPAAARRAYDFARAGFEGGRPYPLAPPETANSRDLTRALGRLARAPREDRRRLVAALAAAAASDRLVTEAEHELLRASAAALDVPLPLIAQGPDGPIFEI